VLADLDGDATDVALPEEGTEGHLTLLLATHLADRRRADPTFTTTVDDIVRRTRGLIREHQAHWRQEITQPGADRLFTTRVLARLAGLALVRIGADDVVQPLPARPLRDGDVEKDPANLWKRTSLIDADSKLAKTLAATGRADDALDVVRATLGLMEQTSVEPTNASIRSAFADAYAELGHARALVASSRAAAQPERWRAARDLFQRSHDIWTDLRDRGILSPIDQTKLHAVDQQIAKCERMLSPSSQLSRR
jgi:hypothetical protein